MSLSKQIGLFEEHKGILEIKKHSALVAINNVTNFQQRRVMNPLLWIAKDQLKRSPERRIFSIELGILKKLAGIGRNDNRELKNNLKGLISKVIEYNLLGKDKNSW